MPTLISNKKVLVASFLFLALTTALHAEEKSTWQKFKDWFNPSPTLEGEGPLYDELKQLDEKINKAEGQYSRERRPNNKSRIKKEIEELKKQRDVLVEKIKSLSSSSATNVSEKQEVSSSAKASSSSAAISSSTELCKADTVFLRDTVTVHDTLYVIVAGKPNAEVNQESSKDSTSANSSATDKIQ